MNTKIKMFTAMILWIAVCITILWFCTSCQERTDPHYKNLAKTSNLPRDRVNVEDTKQYKYTIFIPDSEYTVMETPRYIIYSYKIGDSLIVVYKEYLSSLKDSLEILKDQIKMKDLMLEYQKTAIEEMKNELRSRNR